MPGRRLYFYFSVFEPLFARVAERLQQEDGAVPLGGFLWGRDQRAHLKASGVPWQRLDVFSEWLDALPSWRLDPAYLEAAEARYGMPNLSLLVHADRHLPSRFGHDDLLKILEMAFRRFEEVMDRDRPDALIVESVDSMVTLALYAVARDRGVPVVMLDAGRIPGRTAVHGSARQRWAHVERAFEGYRLRGLPAQARERAARFVEEFRAKKPRLPYFHGVDPSIKRADFGRFARFTRRYYLDPGNVTLTPPFQMLRQRALRQLRHRAAGALGYFERPVPGERYVLYPLHFQPEATTLVCAPFFLDQLSLIEDLSKSLPAGYRLYVKEHFASVGRRSLADYRRIRSLWNARLIGPYESAHDLVQGAAAVAVITGTMGWEALLWGKPVVTFGDVFYDGVPGVIRAGERPKPEWPALFRAAVNGGRPSEDDLLAFVAAVLEGTHDIPILFDNPWTRPAVLEDQNVRNIVEVYRRALRALTDEAPPLTAAPPALGAPPGR